MFKKITIIKKKEVILTILAILFLIIGFINYNPISTSKEKIDSNEENLGEAVLVNSNSIEENIIEIEEHIDANEQVEDNNDNYFLEVKMERDNIYSQTLEIYEKIVDNTDTSNEQKVIAQNEISNISNEMKSISIAENLIKLKGFENVVILKNKDTINVIIKNEQLEPAQVAQIQNIIEREFEIDAKNISITTK